MKEIGVTTVVRRKRFFLSLSRPVLCLCPFFYLSVSLYFLVCLSHGVFVPVVNATGSTEGSLHIDVMPKLVDDMTGVIYVNRDGGFL